MTDAPNSTMPIPGDFHVERDVLVRLALERMATQTRRGVRSAIDELPDGVRYSIGLLKAQGLKHREIHGELIIALGLKPDDEDIPNYHALNRWLDRFGFVLGLVRSAERSRLASAVEIAKATGDLRDGAIIANKMILGKFIETIAECPDLRDLSNGQLGNLISALSVATKAGLDDRKLTAALQLAEARVGVLLEQVEAYQQKRRALERAAEAAKAQIEAKAQAGDGKNVDLQTVAAMLDQIMREAA